MGVLVRVNMVLVYLATLIIAVRAEAGSRQLEDISFTSLLQYGFSTSLGEDVRIPPAIPHSPPQGSALTRGTQLVQSDSYVAGGCRQSEFSFEAAQVRGPIEAVLAIDNATLVAPVLALVQSVDECASWPAKLRYWVFSIGDEAAELLCKTLGHASARAGFRDAGQEAVHEYCSHSLPSGASLIIARPPKAALSTAVQISNMIPWPMLSLTSDQSDPQKAIRLQSFANHLRFAIDQLLPNSSETAIYMDVDTVVRGDLLKVAVEAQGRFRNKTLLMADRSPIPDECIQFDSKDTNHSLQVIGINNKTCAAQHFTPAELNSTEFNAGFMVFNLKLWRKGDAMRRFMHWLRMDQRYSLCKGGNQCPLNLAFVGEHAEELGVLDRSWNCDGFGHKSQKCCPDPAACDLMHWTGHQKPWHLDATYHGMWWDHVQRVEQLVDNRSRQKFVVLTQQRSGSGYLMSMLGSHRLAMTGQEMLGGPPFRVSGHVADWSTRKPLLDSWFAIPRSSVATGFKIMMNQVPLKEGDKSTKAEELIEYLRSNDVLFVILWRRNVLRQYISDMANKANRDEFNRSNAHPDSLSRKTLAQTPVEMPAAEITLKELRRIVDERLELESLLQTTHIEEKRCIVRFYEDLVASEHGDRMEWTTLQAFLGLPEQALRTSLVPIHEDVPMCQSITNWDAVVRALSRTEFAQFLEPCPAQEEIRHPLN
eukprot:TRINITY_DN12476_c0_g2_i1.p1 TRINITY_DN12476_c0_g2~~TRINITY_DN12476_c0_g2_i1.p1  ORF type:complete len:706 (-),score=78.26 TRINITY_DN12476_c0_g2_i1:256-2373(-)